MNQTMVSSVRASIAGVICSALASCSEVAPSPQCMKVTPAVVLGSLADPASVVSRAVEVAHLIDGRWAVSDVHQLDEILVYQANGTYAGILVPQGAGPNEVAKPRGLLADDSDSLWIFDTRRRAIVTTPDGVPARVVANFRGAADGFTEGGLPFESMVRGVEADTAVPFVRFWSRLGDTIGSLGPGVIPPWSGSRAVPVQTRNVWAPSENVVWSGLRPPRGVLIEEWTPRGSRTLIESDDVWSVVEPPINPPSRAWVTGIVGTSADGFSVLVRLAEPATRTVAIADSVDHLGVLIDADATGRILKAILVPGAPVGFVGKVKYFSFREEPSGLVQIVVWHISRECN